MPRVPEPAKVPSAPSGTTCWRGSLFTQSDVSELSTIAGFPEGTFVDHAQAAAIIDGCFKNAAEYGLMDLAAPAPADLRDWYKRVGADAATLVRRLGFDLEPLAGGDSSNQGPTEPRSQAHLRGALAKGGPPFRTLPMELERWLYGSEQFEAEFRYNKQRWTAADDRHLVDLTALVVAQGAIQVLPEVLGVLIAVTRRGALQATERSRGGGNRADTFSRELFKGFARVHEILYRCKPRYRDNEREPEGPAIRWARRLIEIAKLRTPEIFIGDATPLVAALTSDLGLSNGRLANSIQQGWKDWERSKQYLPPRELALLPSSSGIPDRPARKSKRIRGK